MILVVLDNQNTKNEVTKMCNEPSINVHLFDIWLQNLVQQANNFGAKYQWHQRNSYFKTKKKDRKSTTLVIAKKNEDSRMKLLSNICVVRKNRKK